MIVKIDGQDFQVAERWRDTVYALICDLSEATAEEYHGMPAGRPRLIDTGKKKIAIIKAVRTATGLNLKEAKAICDRAPEYLPPMSPQKAAAFVREARECGAIVEPPERSVVDRLAEIGEKIEKETPQAETLYSQFLIAQEKLTLILRAGENNGVFRAKVEAHVSADDSA
jgi:ribosomal protein L7/L12